MTGEHAEFVSELYDATVEQIDSAIDATVGGLVLSKVFVAETAANFSIENTQEAISNAVSSTHNLTVNVVLDFTDSISEAFNDAQDFVADTYDATNQAIQETGQALIYAMLGVKQQLHEMADNFDSQQGVNAGIVNIGMTINASLNTAEDFAASTGVFNAMDNIVQGIGQLPYKINNFLANTFGSGQATPDEYDNFEDIENEDTIEDVDEEIRPKRQENMEDENQGILRFLQKELGFWNKLSEML